MAKVTQDDLLELSIPERLAIIEDLWDSLAANPAALPVTEPQQRELDKRLTEYETDPRAGQSWARVREETQSGLPNHWTESDAALISGTKR